MIAMLVEGGWELTENSNWIIDRYRTATVSLDYYGDSIVNSLSDTLRHGDGLRAGAEAAGGATIALALAFEILVGIAHPRQSHPQRDHADPSVRGIRQWQAGPPII